MTCAAAGPAWAGTCSSPTANEGGIIYNGDYHTYQFCNGTNWIAMGPGGCFAPQSGAYQPTIPSGSGYFVMSAGTYNGNPGGLSGADATCLTDLTTNTGWKGYSTANSNGLLTSSHVHAFLCGLSTCNTLTPLATYVFANAGDSSAGGASFTTDSNGDGPNDSANWSAANYFNGTYTYWTANSGNTSTAWSTVGNSNLYANCNGFSTTGVNGITGQSGYTNGSRWDANDLLCSTTYNFICFVNP